MAISGISGSIKPINKLGRALLWLFYLACLAFAGKVVLTTATIKTNGFAAYYTAAYILRYFPQDMGLIYDNNWFAQRVDQAGFDKIYDIFNIQPATMALTLYPIVGFTPENARIIWTATNLFFLIGGIFLLTQILGGPGRTALWIFPVCFLYQPVVDNFHNGQAYLLIFFILCGVYYAVARRRDWLAGIGIGGMAILKTAGLWLWPLLLLVRHWKVLAWALVTCVVVTLLTLPLVGLDSWRVYLHSLPQLLTDPKRYVTAYQTITSLFGHLFVYAPPWSNSPVLHMPILAQVLTLSLTLASLALSAHWGRAVSQNNEDLLLMLGLFTALIATNTPYAEGHHYTLVLPALVVALIRARVHGLGWPNLLSLAMAVFLLGAPLPYRSPRFAEGWWALLAYPRVYGAYLLWGWYIWQIKRNTHTDIPSLKYR